MATFNNRMAGEIWRTYDVASRGGADFDEADFNHLKGKNYSPNDIFKIAAASGNVRASADQLLRKLSEEHEKQTSNPTINLRIHTNSGRPNYAKRGEDKPSAWTYGSANDILQVDKGKRFYETGDASERLYWNGINANGEANALRGIRVEPDGKYLKRRDVTWRVPDDYLASRASAASPANTPKAKAQDPVAPPLSERFDASKYSLRTPVSTSGSDTEDEREQERNRYGITSMGGGIELGGYERFIKGLPSGLV